MAYGKRETGAICHLSGCNHPASMLARLGGERGKVVWVCEVHYQTNKEKRNGKNV